MLGYPCDAGRPVCLGPEVGFTPRQCDEVPIRIGGQALEHREPDTVEPPTTPVGLGACPRFVLELV